ncbi:hypothetical protein EDB83DRAFT_2532764 [Lactarius deliciosus]|nr:hypothetical protein EDB83DRAFT_2532764 [Lactarius deliciosus]
MATHLRRTSEVKPNFYCKSPSCTDTASNAYSHPTLATLFPACRFPLPPTTIFVRRFKQNFNILETPVLPLGSGHEENAREGIAALLTEFLLPATEKAGDEELLEDARVTKISPAVRAPSCAAVPRTEIHCVILRTLVYRASMLPRTWKAPRHIDLEHLVLLGNQGIGKNKIIDRLCQLREYIQLHRDRDSTVQQLMFQTMLEHGVVRYTDSPLLRAVAHGCDLVVDEAGKAPEHVVAIFRSLAGQGELILLAKRPGYHSPPWESFHACFGNFSCNPSHAISTLVLESECKLLTQLAPELGEDLIVHS